MRKLMIGGRSLFDPSHKWLVIGLFLVVMYFWSSATWVTLVTVDRVIEGTADRAGLYFMPEPPYRVELPPAPDRSELRVESDSKLDVLLTFPDGRKVGDLNEDIRLSDVSEALIQEVPAMAVVNGLPRQTDRSSWQLLAARPANGEYLVEVYSLKGGNYTLELELSDKDNFYTKRFEVPIDLEPQQRRHFTLKYDKNSIRRASFEEAGSWRDWFN